MIFGERRTTQRVLVRNAAALLKEGLEHYMGGIPQWLPAYDEVAEWLTDNKGKGLLASGGMGLGKTRICMDVIPDILRSVGIEPYCVSAYAMSFGAYKEMTGWATIVIDDVGTEDIASFYGERHDLFKEIVDQAERKGILLIVTTNLDGKALNERYGTRTVSRLFELVRPVRFVGESFRGRKPMRPSYAYGVRFDTLQQADDFAAEQERIREGVENGTIRLFDDWAQDAYELQEALELIGNVAYKHGMKP